MRKTPNCWEKFPVVQGFYVWGYLILPFTR